jgi:putative metallohydrolase (TIGR04338 family)
MGFIARPEPRDAQRKRVYAAEQEVAARMRDKLPTIREMQRFVDSILKSRYMQTLFTPRMLAPITVLNGRRPHEATAMSFLSTIAMPHEMRTKLIVLHEMAHILAARYYGSDFIEGHGSEFATFFLDLVDHFLGAEDSLDLLAAFARNGVAHSYRIEGD